MFLWFIVVSNFTAVRIVVLFLLIIVIVFPISMAQVTTIATADSFWTAGARMPTARTELTSAVLKDDIYVIGGFDESGKVTDIVEVYNVKNNTWTKSAPLPEPLHHTTAAAYDGKIYVVGGYTAPSSPSNKLFIYDPIQDKCQEGKPMPTARGALNVDFINGTLYAIGGSSVRPLNSNEAYDPSNNTWSSKALMPTTRHHAGSAVVDAKIFVIGGRILGSSENISVNEAYDPEQNKWITNLTTMPSKRSGIAAAAATTTTTFSPVNGSGSNIYVFGGEEPSKTFNNNEKYNVMTNQWTSEPPMPTACHGLAAVYVDEDNKIYVIGGGPQPGLSLTGANEIFHVR